MCPTRRSGHNLSYIVICAQHAKVDVICYIVICAQYAEVDIICYIVICAQHAEVDIICYIVICVQHAEVDIICYIVIYAKDVGSDIKPTYLAMSSAVQFWAFVTPPRACITFLDIAAFR